MNELTIITPSYTVNNLIEIKKSINFEYIDEWIIACDGNQSPGIFQENKIKEYLVKEGEAISGHGQWNYALTKTTIQIHYHII